MLSENRLLQHIYAANGRLPPSVTLPPGDDMGGLRLSCASGELLIAVDQLVAGVHFVWPGTDLALVGRKALTRNLSDVAAMAAVPVGAVVAAGLPRDFTHDQATELFDALAAAAAAYDCPLVGGDISVVPQTLHLSVTVFAESRGVEPVRRSGAKPGDAIYVSGMLGQSFATGHHLDFAPRLEVARQLAGSPIMRPTAMMDISDGLAMDLSRLVEHAVIDLDRLPLRPPVIDDEVQAWRHALDDGEDYELLFTAALDAPIPPTLAGVRLTHIGRVESDGGLLAAFPDGRREALSQLARGWEHGG